MKTLLSIRIVGFQVFPYEELPTPYEVDLVRCRTEAERKDWIRHLSQKGWGTPAVLDGLREAFAELGAPVWLEATRTGLSFQPVTGITFLIQRVLSGATEELSSNHVSLIREVREKVVSAFGIKNETIAMLFRIGYCGPPSARSLRHPVDEVTAVS